jgi:hypothetical protein
LLSSYNPTTTSTWRDLSGNGNNLTLINNFAAYDTAGEAIHFNSIAYATTSSNLLTGLASSSTDFSVSVWFKYNNTASYTAIFEKQAGVGGGIPRMDIGYGGNVFYWTGWYQPTAAIHDLTLNTPIIAGNWYHTVLTCTGSTKAAYINGAFATSASTITSWPDASQPLGVGGYNRKMDGRITTAQIYNRALSATEVQQLYNATAPKFGYAKLSAPVISTARVTTDTVFAGQLDEVTGPVVTSGLIAYLDAGKTSSYIGTGTIIRDLSNSGANGTINGTISFVNSGTASYFNFASATDTNYISSISTQSYVDVTVVFQPDFTQTTGLSGLISDSTAATSNDDSLRFSNANGTGPWYLANPGDGNDWAYLNTTTFYLNGTAFNTTTVITSNGWNILGGYKTNNVAFPNAANTWSYFIGSSGYPNRSFQGKVAAVLLYNRQLSAAEQQQNYNYFASRYGLTSSIKPPAMQQTNSGTIKVLDKFDEVTGAIDVAGTSTVLVYYDFSQFPSYPGFGTTAYDLSDGTRTRTLGVSGTSFSTEYTGALVIPSGVSPSNSGNPTLTTLNTMSVSMWLKITTLTASVQRFISFSGGGEAFVLRHDGAASFGQLHMYTTQGAVLTSLRINGVLAQGVLYNVVGVADGNNINLYLNGVFQGSIAQSGNFPSSSQNYSLSSASESFVGNMYQITAWNKALTANDVVTNYNLTKRRFGR